MRKPMAGLLAAVALLLGVSTAAQAQWTWTPETGRWVNVKRLPKETPELQLEYARGLLMSGAYKKAMRETDKFENYYLDSDMADDNQFLRGEIRLAQGKHEDAAREFQRVVTAYPNSELFDKVVEKQYEIGDYFYEKGQSRSQKKYAFFKKAPYKKAIDVYTTVIDNQPFTGAAAEAQYKVGLCHFARKEYVEAAYEYRRVVEDYASSEWVDEASYGLAQTYYTSSLPAEYDQSPSNLAIGAIDEFKERYPSDERVPELNGKRQEMRDRIALQRLQTAKFYEKRRQFTAARLCYEVVADDFADTGSADEAKAWLEANPLSADDPSAFIFPKVAGAS